MQIESKYMKNEKQLSQKNFGNIFEHYCVGRRRLISTSLYIELKRLSTKLKKVQILNNRRIND